MISKKSLLIALLASTVSSIAFATPYNVNLLTNPGAETGDLSGWTKGGVSNPFVDNGSFDPGINPNSGSYDFVGGTGADGSLSQNVSLSGLSGANLANISFYEQGLNQGEPSDNGYVSLTFFNSSNAEISSVSSSVIDSHNLSWQNFQGSFVIPTGTDSITYTMNFVRNKGSDLDTFFDSNVLTVSPVPEPETLAMMVCGLSLMSYIKGRKKSIRNK